MSRWHPELVSVVDRLVLDYAMLPPGTILRCAARCRAKLEREGVNGPRLPAALEDLTRQTLQARLPRRWGQRPELIRPRRPPDNDTSDPADLDLGAGTDAGIDADLDADLDLGALAVLACGDSAETYLSARWSRRGAALVVRLSGELDLAAAPVMVQLARAFGLTSCTDVELDLAELSFCDCSGIGHLVRLRAAAAARGGALRVVAVNPTVHRLMARTGLAGQFDLPVQP